MFRFKRKLNRVLVSVIASILLVFYLVNFVIDKSNVHNAEIKLRLIEDQLFLRMRELRSIEKDLESLEKHKGNARFSDVYEEAKESREYSSNTEGKIQTDIQMLELYKDIPFDNVNGDEWTQGWKINYDSSSFNQSNKLKVFVVPHSHNDPGWLRTFDEYYERVTKYVLYTMLNFLSRHHDMKFIWAEISFFARWYERLPKQWKREIQDLVKRDQLEFVTGGWVMPDEANSHWLGITFQLIEGHNWLKKHLNVVPKSAWAIDPFGHSSSMPYLLKKSNIENMLIQRTHYEVKKRLAQEKHLEFQWRQIWDESGETDMFTHMMPFLSYGAPYSCGPDPKVCCQFDFERLPDKGRTCKWGIQPEEITNANVVEKAHLLLDQWRKKSTLYNTKSLLVPLGDDFRYSHGEEWKDQYENYKKLFTYMNNQENMFIEAKFATLHEYFDSIHEENQSFPSLSGDFFTYADRDDHYWSGYYTSRPYYKRMDRVLLHYLRSAEMMYSWNKWQSNMKLERRLRNATQALSLFQHHDGITGTARARVVEDYARMLDFGVRSCKFVMQQAAYRLLTHPDMYRPDFKRTYFDLDDSHWAGLDDEVRTLIVVNESMPLKYVSFHNSLPQWREEVIELLVSTPFVKVVDSQKRTVLAQVSPVWTWYNLFFNIINPVAVTSKFTLHFKVKIPPLGLETYTIMLASPEELEGTQFAEITILTKVPFFISFGEYPRRVQFGKLREFQLRTPTSGAYFTKNGFLKIMSGRNNAPQIPIDVEFLQYGTKSWFSDERSGAYLFLPDGPAVPFVFDNPTVVITEGSLESTVSTGLPFAVHKTILRDDLVEVRNFVDIGDMGNSEIVMRITTNINSGDEFYTDLNGLQILKRLNFKKLPLQANYYPVPTAIYIEDELSRLTVLSAQPLGGSSLTSGQIDIMQDRRLKQGDGRGLGEGVLDNKPVMQIFRLIIESRENCQKQTPNSEGGSLTAHAHEELQRLLHPIDKLIFTGKKWPGQIGTFGAEHKPLNNDIEIGILQHLPKEYRGNAGKGADQLGLIVHRSSVDECDIRGRESEQVDIRGLLDLQESTEILRTSIAFTQIGEKVNASTSSLRPMDIEAFIIRR